MRSLSQLKALFSFGAGKDSLETSLKQFLDANCQQLNQTGGEGKQTLFLESLDALLKSEDLSIRQMALRWLFEDFTRLHRLPPFIQADVFQRMRVFKGAWLAYPLLEWAALPDTPQKNEVILWLSELDFAQPTNRHHIIETLMQRYLNPKLEEPVVLEALKKLDALGGEVTDNALHRFPAKTTEQNHKIIHLLGQTGRYRVVRPLIAFVQEYPEYLRPMTKALAKFEYDEADTFYMSCLTRENQAHPMVLIEAIKQVRKRRLRKAIPQLSELFPMEENRASLINRAVNGEIALTMASFGGYVWARENLIAEMMLNGINQKYLKAVDMLNLEEAVPLLKAILLAPETAEITGLQHQAYQICERLLLQQRAL